MSILKMVNEKGTEKKRMYAKDDYLTAASKTDNGKLVGSSNCMSRYVVEEMLAVKRVFHKSGGRSWVEGVVSLTPDLKSGQMMSTWKLRVRLCLCSPNSNAVMSSIWTLDFGTSILC